MKEREYHMSGGGYSFSTDRTGNLPYLKFNFEVPEFLDGKADEYMRSLGLDNNANYGKVGDEVSFSSTRSSQDEGASAGDETVSEIDAGNAALGSSDRDVVSGALDGVRGLDVDGTAPVVNAEVNVVTSEGNVVNENNNNSENDDKNNNTFILRAAVAKNQMSEFAFACFFIVAGNFEFLCCFSDKFRNFVYNFRLYRTVFYVYKFVRTFFVITCKQSF